MGQSNEPWGLRAGFRDLQKWDWLSVPRFNDCCKVDMIGVLESSISLVYLVVYGSKRKLRGSFGGKICLAVSWLRRKRDPVVRG